MNNNCQNGGQKEDNLSKRRTWRTIYQKRGRPPDRRTFVHHAYYHANLYLTRKDEKRKTNCSIPSPNYFFLKGKLLKVSKLIFWGEGYQSSASAVRKKEPPLAYVNQVFFSTS